jgi:TPP-dependent pyruvate/acetoin dehydrogenase alpha subunit
VEGDFFHEAVNTAAVWDLPAILLLKIMDLRFTLRLMNNTAAKIWIDKAKVMACGRNTH